MSKKSSPSRDTDPGISTDVALRCMHCNCCISSLDKMTDHVAQDCPSQGRVQVYCGCCRTTFDELAALATHLNRASTRLQRDPPSSPSVQAQRPSTSVFASDVSGTITTECTSAATTSSTVTFPAAANVACVSSSAAVPSDVVVLPDLLRHNAHLHTLARTLALHLVWLSGIVARSPDFSLSGAVHQLTLPPPGQLPDSTDLLLRRILAASPIWPADAPDINTASVHSLMEQLAPLYSAWVTQPPLD